MARSSDEGSSVTRETDIDVPDGMSSEFIVEVMDEIERGVMWVRRQIVMAQEQDPGTEDLDCVIGATDNMLQCCLILEAEIQSFESIRRVLTDIREYFLNLQESRSVQQISTRYTRRGRPCVSVSVDQILFYIEHGFTIADIAKVFHCSRRTIERRMSDAGLTMRNTYSNISDEQLVEITRQILSMNPRIGAKVLDGMLRSRDIKVQRHRVRDCLLVADPSSHRIRLMKALHRRKYSVRGSNALWHVDGYHKLIRWRFVVHGGVDGYSRVVLYLRASNNNKSDTAKEAFLCGVQEYGLPSRVRSDKGGENVGIAEYMVNRRGIGRGSIITGRSVHNQRIERLWRDLFTCCVSYFYFLFYAMEGEGVLRVDEEVDLYALHFVFMPKLQAQLDMFRQGWCHHRLRTERNRTPHQLWILGFENYEANDCCISGLHVRIIIVYIRLNKILQANQALVCHC